MPAPVGRAATTWEGKSTVRIIALACVEHTASPRYSFGAIFSGGRTMNSNRMIITQFEFSEILVFISELL